ncbi:hypothetical protein EN873_16610 [bacterium M00.F.Ca.ET.230.01.1.1]|nr:hypothetical protein EN873_16610 [bacterium M00.F.Ca.ET.230.01.1.1]
MANNVFRFYTDDPEFVFDHLCKRWREAVLRWDGRRVGASNIWLMVIVLDGSDAVTAFQSWLREHGKVGDLVIRKWLFGRIMTVPNTILVRKRRRILGWLRPRASLAGSLP